MPQIVPDPTGVPADDQRVIDETQASAASLSQLMQFPDGKTYQVTTGILCGPGLGPVPLGIVGERTVLKATVPNAGSIVSVSNVHLVLKHFRVEGFVLDADGKSFRCLSMRGGFSAFYRRLELLNAQSIGFGIDAGRGFGVYFNEISGIIIRNAGYLGFQWWDDLKTPTDGAHIQGNTVENIQVDVCGGGGGWVRGMQGSIRTLQAQENKGWGLIVDNTLTLSLDDDYFEANMIGTAPNAVDSAVFVDDATVKIAGDFGDGGVVRRGGHWIGRVQGTVNVR